MPPSAGPTVRARLNEMVFSAMAWGTSFSPTCWRTDACQAGALSAVPMPSDRVSASSSTGVISPAQVRADSTAAAQAMPICEASMIRRRS